MGVSLETLKNFDEEVVVSIISNAFHDFHDHSTGIMCSPNVNPIEKILEQTSKLMNYKKIF